MSSYRRSQRAKAFAFALAALVFSGIGWHFWRWHTRGELQAGMRNAFATRRYTDVEQLARKLQRIGGIKDDFLWLAGQAAVKDLRFTDAINWLDQIPEQSSRHIESLAVTGEISLLSLHRLSFAESRLRKVLELAPEHLLARQQLAGILGLTGRTYEASQERIQLIRQRRFTRIDLMLMGLRETALENGDQLANFDRDAPDDPLTHLARGNFEFVNHRLPTAETHLRLAIRDRPDLIKAHALLGRLLVESRRIDELPDWRRGLPDSALDHAEIWTVCGDWARTSGRLSGAIRCYLEAIQRDPLQQQACYHVAQLLQNTHHSELAERFRSQATELQEQLIAVKRFHSEQDHSKIQSIVESCEKLGMLWEAYGWTLAASESQTGKAWIAKVKSRLEPRLVSDLGRVVATSNPTMGIDLNAFPLPDWSTFENSNSTLPVAERSSQSTAGSQIGFRDDAPAAGLKFDYFTGHDSAFGGKRVFEFAGGGVGVLDYDLDGWPDLYFTQGSAWPPAASRNAHLDRLFRNRDGERIDDATDQCRLVENRHSHGVAVGDWNNDGFPDLYIGNAGQNRLFLNVGDGTFTDVTDDTATGGNQWTTSCVIADLNGDGFPDLYAANYLAGDRLYDRLCAGSGGRSRACTPHDLDAAPDEFYLNLGDGRFSEQTAACGFRTTTGKSLGLLAADFDGSGRLSLFVANDTDGNHFFRNVGQQGECKFDEQALLTGLAFDHEGRSLACMGVAAGDANGDGKLDLFVTNYYGESNTLYEQQATGGFLDRANDAGLRVASLEMLGFGTQFLDADLDGHSDLVVVNGHVDNEQAAGVPYEMPPQFFHNSGAGQFTQPPAKTLGAWFSRPTVGRGLARLDWNRDGRADFVVSHLEHSASLLTNVSSSTGNSIVVQLHGTLSNRDSIGAVVQLETVAGEFLQQLSAGDGYLASNERRLIFGLGSLTQGKRIVVKWPGGMRQIVESPQSGCEYRLIEGRKSPLISRLPRP